MVEHLTRGMMRFSTTSLLVRLLLLFAGFSNARAWAQVDPMRPPDAPVVSATEEVQSSELKSILISTRRTEALIGDRLVRVGEKVGHAHVIKISESEVILRDEHGLQTLKLFPGIEKRIIATGDRQATGATRDSQEKSKR